jgi:hypothetical protein
MVSISNQDNEKAKFRDGVDGTAVAVVSSGDLSGLLHGILYDDIQVTYPTSSTELYTYKLMTVQKAQIQVTYTDSTKVTLLRAQKL